ncbi:hypothetical protein [Sabulibacter ruber]|uniref:hypothetical protein n=1 Tax=Sabulibacter ruber TaxID=2811901 RepID=UPI001A971396|nr:hypothetical protein [Sabulibacter ruber]
MGKTVQLEVLSFVQKMLLGVSIILYAVSLTQEAFSYIYQEQVETYKGWVLALMGSTSVLGGGLLEWFIWLANPLYLFSIMYALKREVSALLTSSIAFGLALSFLFWKEVLAAESGIMGPIVSRGAGYFLWVLSIFIWSVAIYWKN